MHQKHLSGADHWHRSVCLQTTGRQHRTRCSAGRAGPEHAHISQCCVPPNGVDQLGAASAAVCKRALLLEAASMLSTIACMHSAPVQAAAVAVEPFEDADGRFKVLVPRGWKQVNLLSGTGILASWYDAENRGSDVLAVYAAPTTALCTADLGSAQDVGEAFAHISPGGQLQQWGSRTTGGKEYITTQVLFTGISAGSFSAVVDIRCSVVAEGSQYTLRIASKAANLDSNPDWYNTVQRIVESFELH